VAVLSSTTSYSTSNGYKYEIYYLIPLEQNVYVLPRLNSNDIDHGLYLCIIMIKIRQTQRTILHTSSNSLLSIIGRK